MVKTVTNDVTPASLNDMNIPVNIYLINSADENFAPVWKLTYDVFHPRHGDVVQEVYEATSDNREELVALVRQYILPLYETALVLVKDIISGKSSALHYWARMD